MKKIFLVVAFLCVLSCKKEIKQNSNTVLEPTKVDATRTVVNDDKEKGFETFKKEEIVDTLSVIEKPVKTIALVKEKKTSDTEIQVPGKKEKIIEKPVKTIALVKEKKTSDTEIEVPGEKEKIIEQPQTLEKELVKQEVVEVEKEPVIVKANHEAWDALSKVYVSSNGKVNYKGFKTKLAAINSYLLHLQNTPPIKGWTRNEKLAYWFNLYNASTVRLIVDNYPVKSIKDINGGKPWDKKFIKSGTHLYSLNDIENTLVRPNYNEPRLHVAFNCAAVSCPNLLKGAFLPAKLNSQLNLLSRKWLDNSLKNKITADAIEISKIFDWYKVDFKEGVIAFINKNHGIKVNANAKVGYIDYNWALNE